MMSSELRRQRSMEEQELEQELNPVRRRRNPVPVLPCGGSARATSYLAVGAIFLIGVFFVKLSMKKRWITIKLVKPRDSYTY